VQSALRGDVEPVTALREIGHTIDGATELANQMLALAKVEQLRQQGDAGVVDWAAIVRTVALDLSALIAERQLEFSLDTAPAPVRAHEWALRELTRNLMHNAIKFSPLSAGLTVTLARCDDEAVLTVADAGPGVDDSQRQRLFQPFAGTSADAAGRAGSGLGLAICHEIVRALGGSIALDNLVDGGRVVGLAATVRLLLVVPPAGTIADNRVR
jgi:two-component system sensor histidine kinase TctE